MVSKQGGGDSLSTPMMRQYLSMKERYRDEILFFRMGDFYEMFFDDARVASEILGIALTSRSKDRDAIPMAGVPIRSVDTYLPRLLKAGKRVAICEQVQDARDARGLVDREVVRVVSPGTITDERIIGEKSNNFIVSLVVPGKGLGLAWIDLSTGEFQVWEDARTGAAIAEVSRLSPAECVLPESLARGLDEHHALREVIDNVFLTPMPDWCFDADTARRTLTEHFGTRTLEGFGCEHMNAAVRAAGGLLHYLQETQKNALGHITRLRPHSGAAHMLLDPATRRALEITEKFRGGDREGTLLHCFDRTVTALGARRLRDWLLKPLVGVGDIRSRQEGVQALVDSGATLDSLREVLRGVHDLERICARISYGSANGRDLAALGTSLEALPAIAGIVGGLDCHFFAERVAAIDGFEELAARIGRTLVDSPPIPVREGGIIRDGFDAELDALRELSSEGTQWIARYQQEETERVGIPSLKVGFNRVFGYYIEVTNAHADRVPAHYIRKQTLKNAERYITPELKEFENRVLHARETAMEREYGIFCELRDAAGEHIPDVQLAARAVAEIDVIAAFAFLGRDRGYTRPIVDDSDVLSIEDGRHPVIETLLPSGEFVPNSIDLDSERPIVVITGPNMAGKSTYIRQVALLVLLAHTGSFVPAARARIGVVDRIFTRVGAADDIARGQSTFMVEMQETANILNNATRRSLLVLDEVGRGTSTFDGLSLAWAITEHITESLRARTLFATHYQELTELALTTPLVRNCTFQVKEWNDEIVFLRKVVDGATDKSYGIHVARLAGIPRGVIQRAREVLARLEAQAIDVHGRPAFAPPREPEDEADGEDGARRRALQLDLFQNANEPILQALKSADIDAMTPLEALNYLAELRRKLV